MRRSVLWVAGVIVLLIVAVWLGSLWLSVATRRAVTNNGTIRDFHEFTAEQLEREVRSGVPIGSTRDFVNGFLTGEGMRFGYDPALYATTANAPFLKGSGIIVSSLGLTFRFDRDSRLTAIEAKVHLTGP